MTRVPTRIPTSVTVAGPKARTCLFKHLLYLVDTKFERLDAKVMLERMNLLAPPVSRAGSDSRVMIIPALDSEAPEDCCRELCDLFVDLLNGDPVPLLMQHLLHLGNGFDL